MSQRELQYQRKVVVAAEGRRGYAKKLSHRTLVGIPDLLVKLPRLNAALVEVKRAKAPKKAEKVKLDLTAPQRRNLEAASKAGMHACVLGFLEHGGTNIGIGIWSVDAFPKDNQVGVMSFKTVVNRDLGEKALDELVSFMKFEERKQ